MRTAQKAFPNFPPEVVSFTSSKPFDFSLPQEPPFFDRKQNQYLRDALDQPPRFIVNIRQVHGDSILTIDAKSRLHADEIFEADGVVSNVAGVALTLRTADCLPIFIYEKEKKVLALVHAGWRGSYQQIAVKALDVMRQHWGCSARDSLVAFGPAIRPCCYEVGGDFLKMFSKEIERRTKRYFLNLPLININQMVDFGIDRDNIYDCGICTCCHQGYFSYRRDGRETGRNLSLAMIRRPK